MTKHLQLPPPLTPRPHWALGLAVLAAAASLPGCIRTLALGAKVLAGDPSVTSAFEQQTGTSLEKGLHMVALVVDVPHVVADDFASLASDLQAELDLRLRRHGVKLADPDAVDRALERGGSRFSADGLARQLEVDRIVHVQIERFTDRQSGSSSLRQSYAQGVVTAYEVRGTLREADRHAVAVYEQPFSTTYPSGQPVPAEQMPRAKFVQNTVRAVADVIGRQFYTVQTSDLF